MRICLSINGWNGFLFNVKDAGALVDGLSTAIRVRTEGYGAERKFVPEDDQQLQFEIVPEDHVGLPDTPNGEFWAQSYAQSQKELNETKLKLWSAEQKLKNLEQKESK